MSETPKFTIRRITSQEEAQPQTKPSPAQKPQKSAPDTPKTERTAGHFVNANKALAFLGSVFGTQLADIAAVRRSPPKTWWVEIDAPRQRIVPLIWTAGGQPFAYQNSQWIAQDGSGTPPDNKGPVVELAELLAEASLPANRYREAAVLNVVTPGELGRWILHRAAALGLAVTITPASGQPLSNGKGQSSAVLLMRLQALPGRTIPAALVYRLSNLPYTAVAVPALDTEREKLLVDVRHRLPLAAGLIEPMIPPEEIWLLGTQEVNSWRLHLTGNPIDGSLLLDAPQLPKASSPKFVPPTKIPKPIPVRLVPRPQVGQQVDAVLLDDRELGWVRSLLMGRPIGEMSFLLLGNPYHLLTAPGGLPAQIPLGIPLVWKGPDSLYLELGKDFYPPLPPDARRQRFNLNSQSVVAVAQNHTYHFELCHLTPAWSLWVGTAPDIQLGVTPEALKLLNRISPDVRKSGKTIKITPLPEHLEKAAGLLEQAQRAEMRGDLVRAATLLEEGGYSGQAGRLYERMAKIKAKE